MRLHVSIWSWLVPLIVLSVIYLSGMYSVYVITHTDGVSADILSGDGLRTVHPYRVLDTRQTGIIPAGTELVVQTNLVTGVTAAAVNITITENWQPGFLTAWAGGAPGRPNTSIVNASVPNDTVANYAIIPVNATGAFTIYNSMDTHIVVDVMGFFAGPQYTGVGDIYWTEGATIDLLNKTMPIVDGREPDSIRRAITLINQCAGAVLYWGELADIAWIGAHRTACGDAGFGGLEYMQIGDTVWVNSGGQIRQYYLFYKMNNVPLTGITSEQVPHGTNLILQTSQASGGVYLRFFRMM